MSWLEFGTFLSSTSYFVSLVHYHFLTAAAKTRPNLCVSFICDGRKVTLVAAFNGFWWPCWLQIPVEVPASFPPPDPAFTNAMVRDALHKAVMDFEETLQRSHSTQVTYTTRHTDVTGQPTAVEVTDTGELHRCRWWRSPVTVFASCCVYCCSVERVFVSCRNMRS